MDRLEPKVKKVKDVKQVKKVADLESYSMQAYERLKFYQDICNIRRFVQRVTKRLEKSHLRLVSHMMDSARSAKQNIREGYRRGSAAEFAHSIKISQGSLEELSGDMED